MSEQKKILITRRLPEAVIERACQSYRAAINSADNPYGADQMLARARGMDGLLCTISNDMSRPVIMGLPESVRIIATFSVGFEHIDLDAAGERGIVVTNTPGVLTAATADMTMLLMLGAARRAGEGAKMMARGWTGWTPTQLLGIEVSGKRLGIVGMGEIGRAVAARAAAFDMTIHYHNRHRLTAAREGGAIFHETLESLLPVSDFLSLHCPLTAATKHLLNEARIAMLPPRPVVVNTARGPVVDDRALIAALQSGRVAAAGLDVFEGEPDIAPGYLECPNAFLLPHLGSATVETRNAMGFLALDNLDSFFAGREPPNRIA